MDAHLQRVTGRQNGVILRAQALEAGYSDSEIFRLRQRREWTMIRRGAYVVTRIWDALDDVGRHKMLIHAVINHLSAPAVPSHVSAAVLHNLRVWDIDLSVVHVTRADLHSPRFEAGVMHHAGALPERDLTVVDGIVVTSIPRTVVDVGRSVEFERAVVVADSALAEIGKNNDPILHTLNAMRDWPGARAAGRAVEFSDGLSESVGESRLRVQFDRIGLPRPQLQVPIGFNDGMQDRVDFLFEEEQTVAEFDGQVKYGRLLAPDQEPGTAVWHEKIREDRIRDLGYEFVRSVWADLYRDDAARFRYRRAFKRSRRRVVVA
jgi:hypothetical protein